MGKFRLRSFRNAEALAIAVADLLQERMTQPFERPHGILLSGGQTPLPAYRELAGRRTRSSEELFIMLADERMVPDDSPESNFRQVRLLTDAVAVPDTRVLHVATDLELKAAAAQYDRAIQHFVKSGGRITLGLLGLGADGHTASLFSEQDVLRGAGVYAIGVRRAQGPSRVSVTPDLLKRVEALIFLVAGREKDEVVARLMTQPETIPAGLAVRNAPNVQVWVA